MKRFLRFSVRSILLATLVIAVAFGFAANRYRKIKAANVAIRDAGGKCGISVDGPQWLRQIVQDDDYFTNVASISIHRTRTFGDPHFNNERLSELIPHINQFSEFSTLSLRSDVTDDGLSLLADLPRLRNLDICSPSVTDAGIANLHELTELRSLLVGRGISEHALDELQSALPKLKIRRFVKTNGKTSLVQYVPINPMQ
ncbi:hypothetical protein [Allorhodopirellula heiligendammensis]|uniref:Leucine Rich repeats (2 copies) n=1 Tax=Allorhodopirellula heiligendammensis TaxID=2714739 RepID=A0A5C6B1P0_9BACT|nr:hypothetical protein [Allorhodopirellula heiligendammensis]TWU05332.1 hypothetical protein Poly21_57590 [Allorhodopirellula heiligendammensis]